MSYIAFLGTGLLGGAFAEAAAQRGDTVTAWNRSPDKVHALKPFGVIAAASPAGPAPTTSNCVRSSTCSAAPATDFGSGGTIEVMARFGSGLTVALFPAGHAPGGRSATTI